MMKAVREAARREARYWLAEARRYRRLSEEAYPGSVLYQSNRRYAHEFYAMALHWGRQSNGEAA